MRAASFWARTLCATGWIAGCSTSHDAAGSAQVGVELAALMEDGPLPNGMMPDAPSAPVPPRFCDPAGGGGTAGVGGRPAPGPLPPFPPIGMAGPVGIAGAGGIALPDAGASDPMAPRDAGTGSPIPGEPQPGDGGVAFPDGGMEVPGDGGIPGEGEIGCARFPIAFWRFDDCNLGRTTLEDSSPESGHPAFRHVEQQCVETQEGLGAAFARKDDLVYAPDQPGFALDRGVTVAAWVKPERIHGVRTLFRKRDGDNSAFALVINGRKYQFVVRLASGRLVSVSAPATAGVWTHVAATYDNEYLRLYVGGEEVASKLAGGRLAKGPGPLLMGNDASNRRLDGVMDNAWFNTLAAPPDTILELTCLRPAPTVAVSPEVGPEVPAGTPVDYRIAITNHDTPVCSPAQYAIFANLPEGFSSTPPIALSDPTPPGETTELTVSVASGEETEPDQYPIGFNLFSFDSGVNQFVEATYVVAPPEGCHMLSSRTLMIRHVSVVDDPLRTNMDGGDPADPRTGAWSFGRMMERLSPAPADAPDVTEDMLRSFVTEQVVNGFAIVPRPSMDPVVLDPWPRTPDGKLDLARAPLRLLAIVNRLDLKDLAAGKAGEGRLIYGVLSNDIPLEFTVILEYLLPAADEAEYRAWVEAFHALQELPFPSEEYNAALQAITDRFTGRDALPGAPNGSLLIDIRTNEIALGGVWQLREFHISPVTGFMIPAPLFQTPDFAFEGTERLARFIDENEAAILAETHDAPLTFEGEPFKAASIFNNIDFWNAPGIANPEARHKFSLNTCNGCHGAETNTAFLHVLPRFAGQQSTLSGFLTGIDTFDPISGQPRRLAELARRRALLEPVVCDDEP